MSRKIRIGVISDTHGLLRPEAASALQGVDHIIHAGDMGKLAVLEALRLIAPVTAVRGNVDQEAWARDIPETAILQFGQVRLYVIHNGYELGLDLRADGFAALISGHTHKPKKELRNGVLYFNPGSAGARRFDYPISLGYLSVEENTVSGEIIELVKKP